MSKEKQAILFITTNKSSVTSHQEFYNKVLSNGMTMKQTLDNIIYEKSMPKRQGTNYAYFATRAY